MTEIIVISGVFTTPEGAPYPNVKIGLTLRENTTDSFRQLNAAQVTDGEGKYKFELLPGEYDVAALYPNGKSDVLGSMLLLEGAQPGTLNDYLLSFVPGPNLLSEMTRLLTQMEVAANGALSSAGLSKSYAESSKFYADISERNSAEAAKSESNAAASSNLAVENAVLARKAASESKMYSDTAQAGAGVYDTGEKAQQAIDAGTEQRTFFPVWSTSAQGWTEKWQNVGGVATPTGEYLSNSNVLDAALADVAQQKNKTALFRQYFSNKWLWSVEGKGGPSETGIALDNDFGLWLAGLDASIQDYIEQLIPRSIANRYQNFQHVIVAKNGIDGLVTINDNGDIRIVGTDDVLQDRLNAICSTTFSRRIVGFQFVIFTSDMKTALLAIDDDGGVHIPGVDGPLQDNLGESLATIKTESGVPAAAWRGKIVWSERPVLTAQKLTSTGFIFSYVPGGEAKAGNGVKYEPSIREMPIDANEAHGGGSGGQSLNTPKDGAGINIVNRDPAFRGRVLAGANGRPEGGGMDPVSESDLSTLNDAQYPDAGWRQGNVLPMYYAILHQNPGNQVFIHAPFAAGGRSFAEISKGTIPYQNSLDFVQLGKNAADGVGKRYTFKFMTFEHGETDNDNGSSQNPGDYLAKMKAYFPGLQVDFKAITGQVDNFTEVIGQVGSRVNTKNQPVDDQGNPIGEPVIVQPYSVTATDQLTYVRQNAATAIMYGPKYPLNWLFNDATLSHLNAAGKVLQGEYAAQAIYWHLYNTEKKGTWTGLKVKSLTVSGTIADLLCDVPYAPIVIDTTFIADCLNYGISLEKNSASVQSVTVVDGNIIRVEFDKAPASDDYMLFGFTNTALSSSGHVYPLTCFRDSSPIKSRWITRNNEPFPLYNWACLDRLPLTGEF
ncbi:TPA: prophage tail fiber N-terminal domain-containing protein [Serratia odorifera]